MATFNYSQRYGGSAFEGSASTEPGFDAIIPVGGAGTQAFIIDHILIKYGLSIAQGGPAIDYDDPANAVRSFYGRLLIVENPIERQITATPFVSPNPALFADVPREVGEVKFDLLIHDWREPIELRFPSVDGMGALRAERGKGLTVILLAGAGWSVNAVGWTGDFIQQLHVHATRLDVDTTIRVGPLRAK